MAGSSRLRSDVPGLYTRADVEADLGITHNDLETLERQKVLGPSDRRRRGDTRPAHYTTADLAVARFAVAARRFGLRGEQLKTVTDRLGSKRRHLQPGWHGYVLVDSDWDLHLVGPGESIDAVVSTPGLSALAVWLEVPAVASIEEAAS